MSQALNDGSNLDLPVFQDDLLRDRQRVFSEFLSKDEYQDAVRRMLRMDARRLIINIDDLRSYNREFATGLLNEPNEFLPAFDAALHVSVELAHNTIKDDIKNKQYYIGLR